MCRSTAKLLSVVSALLFLVASGSAWSASCNKIGYGWDHSCAITTGGALKCWGSNGSMIGGQLGNGSTTSSSTPVDVLTLSSGVQAVSGGSSHTCAILSTGGVKCWGVGSGGELGDGTSTFMQTSPANYVSGLSSGVQAIAAGENHTCALTTGGGVKCWGQHGSGQLGNGGAMGTGSNVPVNVSGLTSGVQKIASGGANSCALTTGGAVKCWGNDYYGQLGAGTQYAHSATPKNVVGLSSGVVDISINGYSACAVMASGGVKCWGENGNKKLGDGTSSTNSSVPVNVIGISNAVGVTVGGYHACALLNNGTVNCWGSNFSGQLGRGTITVAETPGLASGLSGVEAVAAGNYHTCAALGDGTIKCWGKGGSGQLGNGATADSASPVTVSGIACAAAVNGACGGPGACSAGSVSGDNGLTSCGTTRTWTCNGSGGGSNASCSYSNAACAVNGVCGGSAGTCSAGSVSGDNGATGCGTTRTWSCNGSGGGSNASCSNANPVCAVNGACSATAGACSAGSPSGDNGATACGTTRSWTCNGSGGGSNASCSKANPVCVVNGVCSSTAGACSSGSVAGDNGATACGTTRTWTCNGSGGGSNASCSKANPLCAVNGTCGSADTVGTMSAPSSNLCSSGTATAVSGTGPWTWNCNGANGGTNASCSAPLMQNGVCGSANGVGVTSAPSSNLCSSGTATAVSGAGPWSWTCNGANGGTNANCSAPLRVDAACGSANGVGAYTAPLSGLCSPGTASAVSGAGPFTWTCAGSNGGANASCAAPLRQDAQCGASHNGNFYAAPATNLCSVGSPTAVSGAGPWAWTCNGVNGGANASCSANKSINGVCGTANGVSTPTSPSSGLCSAGSATAVTNSSYTWNWNCNGINGGTTAICNAPQKVHGSCGPANGSNVYTKPTSGLCATGNATAVIGAGPFDWNCNGINGGNNVSCSANLVVNGVCGPADGQYSASAPTSGLCSAGAATAVAGTGPYTWNCSGVNGGTASGCSSQAIIHGACGPSNNMPTASAPVSGLCSAGTASAVAGSGPWTWSCNGSGGGSKSNCTAPTPPPPPSFGGACPGP